MRFSPAAVETSVGSTIPVSLVIEGGSDVAAAPMQVSFDPKVVRLSDVTAGAFLSADGQQPVFAKNIMNDAGQATVQLNRLPGNPGVSGPSGTLVTFNFQAIAKGVTLITAPNVSVRNSQGAPVATGSPQLTINVK